MKLIELIGVIIVVGCVVGFLIAEDQMNQARITDISTRYQEQVDTLFHQSHLLLQNFTNLTANFSSLLSDKDATIEELNSQIVTLNNQKTEIETLYNNLLENFNSTVNAQFYDLIKQLENVSRQLNETLALILHNPNLTELTEFLSGDNTNYHEYNNTNYSANYYIDTDFSRALINNASLEGWKATPVMLILENETKNFSHSIVVFNTLDHGLAYVEPITDGIYYNLTYDTIYPPYNMTIKHLVILGVI